MFREHLGDIRGITLISLTLSDIRGINLIFLVWEPTSLRGGEREFTCALSMEEAITSVLELARAFSVFFFSTFDYSSGWWFFDLYRGIRSSGVFWEVPV